MVLCICKEGGYDTNFFKYFFFVNYISIFFVKQGNFWIKEGRKC
nr:MAG TPA: hypothetical protein [Caudoviricetes sp.]